jgi:hypothetical protein
MAQADYVVADGTGAAVRSDLNGQLAAIVSNNSGATEPATMYAYQWWADTTTGLLKLRNSANSAWISLRELDGTLLMEDGTAAAPGLSFASDLDTGFFSAGANAIGIATNGVERVEFGTTEVVFNDGGANYDFRIEGITEANLLLVSAGSDEVSFRDDVKIDSSGRLLIGTSTALDTGSNSLLQVLHESGPRIFLSNAQVSINELLGAIVFGAAEGGGYDAASVAAYAEEDFNTDDYPSRLVFSTTADNAASPTERMRLAQDGRLFVPSVWDFSTSGGTTVVVTSDDQIRKAASSIKYKTDVEDLQDSYADQILNIRPVWYRSLCDGDDPNHSYWGFIAEEVAEIDPRLTTWKFHNVSYDENGSRVVTKLDNPEPEGVAYDRFVPHLLNLVKRQGEAIADLQAEVAALKAQ